MTATSEAKPYFFEGTEGHYMLPHHQTEIERLKRQHSFVKDSTDGELLSFALPESASQLRVLDSGCADGTWLMDLASQYRERPMSLHGIDIGSALFESHPDLNLHEHDILQPIPESWGWSNTFDIVHQRFLVWGIKKLDWAVVVRNLCQAVKPGGYIVFVECKWIFPENWEKQREQHKLALTQIWSTETFGMDIHAYAQLEPLLQNVGFVDVKTHSYDWGYGAAAKKPEQKTSSAEMWVESFRHLGGKLSGDGIPGVAKAPEEFHAFLDRLVVEIKEQGYVPELKYVSARKPLKAIAGFK